MKKRKRMLSILLAASLVVSGWMPAGNVRGTKTEASAPVSRQTGAAMDESTYEKLGFNTELPEDSDQDANPYTRGREKAINLMPEMELFVEGQYDKRFTYTYNVSKDENSDLPSGLGLNMGWYNGKRVLSGDEIAPGQNGSNTLLQDAQQQQTGRAWERMTQTRYVAVDLDGDGYKDKKFGVGIPADVVDPYWEVPQSRKNEIWYGVFEGSSNRKLFSELLVGDTPTAAMQAWETNSYLALCAGDFNGDGKDEVAVYKPGTTPLISILSANEYGKFMTDAWVTIQTLEGSLWGTLNSDPIRPVVDLEAHDFDGDGKDELAAAVSHQCEEAYWYAQGNAGAGLYILGLNDTPTLEKKYETRLAVSGYDYGLDPNYTGNKRILQSLNYVGLSVGDMDNNGTEELVMAGHVNVGKRIKKDGLAVVQLGYSERTGYGLMYGGIPFNLTSWIEEGTYDYERQEPVAVECFAAKGNGCADVLFLEGKCYNFVKEEAVKEDFIGYYNAGSTSYTMVPEKADAQGRLALAYEYSWVTDNGDSRWSHDITNTSNRWICDVVSGNFNGNKHGMEQVIYTMATKISGKEEYYWGIASLSRQDAGDVDSAYIRQNEKGVYGGIPYVSHISIAAMDYDDDGMTMRFKRKEKYFSDPNVVAVMQAAPYFVDLESVDNGYVSGGSTAYGQNTGTSEGESHGFTVSAGIITGYEQDVSILGLFDAGGIDFEVEASVSGGYAHEFSTSKSYSTSYVSDSTDDSVVLSMTPYTRYVYETYVPEYYLPTEAEYKEMKKSLPGLKAEYEQETNASLKDQKATRYNNTLSVLDSTEKAVAKGYVYGQRVDGSWEEYYVCIPDTPRMTMLSVSYYDRVAAETEGMEQIRGKLLTNTPGDPYSYTISKADASFDGGQVVGDVSGTEDHFVRVGIGGNEITQSIEVETESTDETSWGAGISTQLVSKAGGAKLGASVGVEYNGSLTWTNYNGTEYSGTVAGIPEGMDEYTFLWRFGTWDGMLNGQKCKVLGYLVKGQSAPPSLPKNIEVTEATDRTLTLNWENSWRKGNRYRISLLEDNGEETPLAEISSKNTSYTIGDGFLAPGKTYRFVMHSIGFFEESAASLPIYGRTKYAPGEDTPTIVTQPEDTVVWDGEDALLSIYASPITGSNGSVKYQWQHRAGAGKQWEDIRGETKSTLKLPAVSFDLDGHQYRCIVTQIYGTTIQIDSNTAELTIREKSDAEITFEPLTSWSGAADRVQEVTNRYNSYDWAPLALQFRDGAIGEIDFEILTLAPYATSNIPIAQAKEYLFLKPVYHKFKDAYQSYAGQFDGETYYYLPAETTLYELYPWTGTLKSKTAKEYVENNRRFPADAWYVAQSPDGITWRLNDWGNGTTSLTLFNDMLAKPMAKDFYENKVAYLDEYEYGIGMVAHTETKYEFSGGTAVALSAQVGVTGEEALTGKVVFKCENTTTGKVETVEGVLDETGKASAGWTPAGEGYYRITAHYQGCPAYNGVISEPQYYGAYTADGTTNVLSMNLKDEMAYGETVPMATKLVTYSAPAAEAKVMARAAGDVSESEVTVAYKLTDKAGNISDITMDGDAWKVDLKPGDYTVTAEYTDGAETFEAKKKVTVEKAPLTVTVDPVTQDAKTNPEYVFNPEALKMEGAAEEDFESIRQSFAAKVDPNEVGKDKQGIPYAAEYSIYLSMKDGAAQNVIYDILEKYEVAMVNSTLTYTGNKTGSYKVQYEAEGKGSLEVASDSGSRIANGGMYAEDTIITFLAIPNKDYEFLEWRINGEKAGTNRMLTHTLADDVEVKAVFKSTQPETSEPGTEPSTETPGTEEPGTETPGTEEPGTETPGTEEPGTETPGTEEPGTETPGTEEPGTETPGTEEPGTETPGTEEPGTETPGTEEPGTETPGTEEPGTETPGTEKPQPGTEPNNGKQPETEQKPPIVTPPEIGSVVNDPKNTGKYQVAKADEVTYLASAMDVMTAIVPDTITIGGATYKVTSVKENAFKNRKKLSKIVFGKNLTKIGAKAFSGCVSLKSVTGGSRLTEIGAKAFYRNTKLTKFTIPASVKKIGKQAFFGCKKLKSITIKTTKLTKKSVGAKAFSSIHKKAVIKVPKKSRKAYSKLLKTRGVPGTAKIK